MARIELKAVVAGMVDGSTYDVPYWHVTTGEEGPCVLVTASLHGNELQGAEVLRRFVADVAPEMHRGSCLLVPFANPVAISRRQPHIDFEPDRYYGNDTKNNVNCSWPGDPDGTNAQRLSNAMFNAILEEPTHNIDLHCWQIARATTVLARSDVEMSVKLAEASAVRFGRRRPGRQRETEGPRFPCVLTVYFNDSGRSAICIELSGQNVIVEREVVRGLRAVTNCFRLLELLPGEPEGTEEDQVWLDENEEVYVRVPCSGLYVRNPDLVTSDRVEEGDLLGHVMGMSDLQTTEIRAPVSGYLYGFTGNLEEQKPVKRHTDHPYVDSGDPVAQIICA